MWQDYVMTFVNLWFAVALVPAVRAYEKPPLLTSIPTAIALFMIAFTLVTLGLWFSAVTTAVCSLLWMTLASQKVDWEQVRFALMRWGII